jgi:ankyrin repeat protein
VKTVDVNERNSYGETAMHISAIKSDMAILQALLDAGGDINAVTDGEYPGHQSRVRRSVLMWYLPMCELDAVKFFVENGVDIAFVNEEGEDAVAIARGSGNRCTEVLALLTDASTSGGKSEL